MFKSVDLLHIQQIQKKSMQNFPRNGISIFDASFFTPRWYKYLFAGKSHAQNGRSNSTPWRLTLIITKVGITWGLIMISWMMYQCLVNYTGAKPAEYYTVQKRPDYANYQKMVNMFVPGPRKELKTE